ncbi:hypothetical protein IFM89_011373 [Coptis chinensis]|uniref:F-box domain-containing protein n=1 Tax=Coptis chinensis TaxID=261450 RepID=A0A835HLX3_9MAGN|nr:hypothetical protein IFM89_011373 [Coptis chinensis]
MEGSGRMERHVIQLYREIMLEIFSRLPIQALSQCKLVCKPWYAYWRSFVTNPHFINLHHSRINQHDPSYLILLDRSSNLYIVDHQSHTSSFKAVETKVNSLPDRIKLVGSSNGLLCICSFPSYGNFYICNPISQTEVLEIPKADVVDVISGSFASGFVFDKTMGNYKIVNTWMTFRADEFVRTRVEVYSLGSGRWRRIESIPSCFMLNPPLLFMNGALHWEVTHRENFETYEEGNKPPSSLVSSIAAFDIGSEKLRAFKKPPGQSGPLSLLGEFLCMTDEKSNRIDVATILKDIQQQEDDNKKAARALHFPRNHIDGVDPSFLILGGEGRKLYLVDHENIHTSLKAIDIKLDLTPMNIKANYLGPHLDLVLMQLRTHTKLFSHDTTTPLFRKGALHWEIYHLHHFNRASPDVKCIAAIDIGTEKFREFKQPPA